MILIEKHYSQLDDLRKKLNPVRDAYVAVLAAELSSFPSDQIGQARRASFARAIYWCGLDFPREWLAEAYGIRAYNLLPHFGYEPVELMCANCAGTVAVIASDVRDRDRLQKMAINCEGCSQTHAIFAGQQHEIDTTREAYEADRRARRAEIERLKALPYDEYLRSDHWQDVRAKALAAAKGRCQTCNSADDILDCHHRTYERRGEELPEDVVILCRACHGTFHEVRQLARPSS